MSDVVIFENNVIESFEHDNQAEKYYFEGNVLIDSETFEFNQAQYLFEKLYA